MNVIDFLFQLVKKFVPMPREQWAEMYKEARDDMDTWTKDHDNKLIAMHEKHMTKWYSRLGVSLLWLPAVKWLQDYTSEPTEEENEEGFLNM